MRETILIIENEVDVARLLRYNFSKAGFSVLVAGNGIEGLEIARKHHPDLIVLDLLLPEMIHCRRGKSLDPFLDLHAGFLRTSK